MAKNKVVLTIEVDFEGTYYDRDELIGCVEEWIGGGLEDRDNLRGWSTTESEVFAVVDLGGS